MYCSPMMAKFRTVFCPVFTLTSNLNISDASSNCLNMLTNGISSLLWVQFNSQVSFLMVVYVQLRPSEVAIVRAMQKHAIVETLAGIRAMEAREVAGIIISAHLFINYKGIV